MKINNPKDKFKWLKKNPPIKGVDQPWRRVMVDIDGIIFPFLDALGYRLRGQPFQLDEIGQWGVFPGGFSHDQISEAIDWSHSYQALTKFGFRQDAKFAFEKLLDHNLEIHICSRRATTRAKETQQALDEQGFNYTVFHASPKVDKTKWCRQQEIKLLVDDKPETIKAAKQAGLRPFTLIWPYNQDLVKQKQAEGADNWYDLANLILAAAIQGSDLARFDSVSAALIV